MKVLNRIFSCLIAWIIFYLIGSYAHADFNIKNWELRELIVCLSVMSNLAIMIIASDFPFGGVEND